MVASAIAGRSLTVRAAAAGSAAYTDGESVYVPEDASPALRFPIIALHASLLGAGSDAPRLLRQLKGQSRTARRYLALEAARARRCLAAYVPATTVHPAGGAVDTRTPEESLAVARSARAIDELEPEWGELRPRALLKPAPAPAPDTRDTLAAQLREGLEPEADDDDDEQAERSKILELFSAPMGGSSWLTKKFLSLAGADRKSSTGSGSPTDRVSKHRRGRGFHEPRRQGISVSGVAAAFTTASPHHDDDGMKYPEWDVHRRAFRENWCTVFERTLPGNRGQLAAPDLLRYPLGRTHLDLRRSRRERLGDELDVDALIMARSDARTGHTPDDRIYSALRRLGRDLGVLILVDISGSTADAGRAAGTVLETQITAAGQLAHTLEARGDRVAIYGFNSRGRSRVYLYRVKEFRQAAESGWQARLGHLEPGGFTRTGAAVRHAVAILTEQSGAKREILLVLSDGIAYDEGYEARYATADTRKALDDARDSGVGCLCLSLGGEQTTAELESVFGTSAFAHAERIADLGAELKTLFNHALLAAERAHRRRHLNGGREAS